VIASFLCRVSGVWRATRPTTVRRKVAATDGSVTATTLFDRDIGDEEYQCSDAQSTPLPNRTSVNPGSR